MTSELYHLTIKRFINIENENIFRVVASVRTHLVFRFIYIPSHTRMAPYIYGILAAYVYQKNKNCNIKISKIKSTLIFLLALIIFIGKIYVVNIFMDPKHFHDVIGSSIFAGIHRHINGLCLATIVLICIFGDVRKLLNYYFFLKKDIT
jgi:hypothetical protein